MMLSHGIWEVGSGIWEVGWLWLRACIGAASGLQRPRASAAARLASTRSHHKIDDHANQNGDQKRRRSKHKTQNARHEATQHDTTATRLYWIVVWLMWSRMMTTMMMTRQMMMMMMKCGDGDDDDDDDEQEGRRGAGEGPSGEGGGGGQSELKEKAATCLWQRYDCNAARGICDLLRQRAPLCRTERTSWG